MPPVVPQPNRATSRVRPQSRARRVAVSIVAAVIILIGGFVAIQGSLGSASGVQAAEPVADDASAATTAPSSTTTSLTTTASSTTTTTISILSPVPTTAPPVPESGYTVPPTEVEPEAKQLAADIAYALTTYGASDDHTARLDALVGRFGGDLPAQATQPLIYAGSWSRGEVIYPQLGGLRNGRASVMVVTRQTVGSAGEVDFFSVVRTLDIHLVLGRSGWEFESLASAGGTFDRLEDLALAHAVARDPRIEMPDSARLDILAGRVSPILLDLMSDIADQTSYAVAVLVTGHPRHVFETDQISEHTLGRAIDIIRVGDRLVIDDRRLDSATLDLLDWLYYHPAVRRLGSPWDMDAELSTRSFTDAVHQDHIHITVNAP